MQSKKIIIASCLWKITTFDTNNKLVILKIVSTKAEHIVESCEIFELCMFVYDKDTFAGGIDFLGFWWTAL